MADVSPQSNQEGTDERKVGSFVERFRSFESDMARLKGVALKPVVPEKKLEEEKPKPIQPIIAGKPDPYLESTGNALSSLRATNTIVSDVVKEDPKIAIETLHKEVPIQTFHTIQTDMADAAKNQGTTPEKMATTQTLRQQRQIVKEDPKRSAYLLAISGLLVLGGLISLGGLYMLKHQPKAPAPVATDAATIIPIQGTRDITVSDSQSLISLIAAAQTQAPGVANEIVKLNIKDGATGTELDSQRFASLLSPSIQTWLVRSFAPAPYLAGLYDSNGWQPFIIFRLTSYDSGYAGMLKWEETIGDEWKPLIAGSAVAASSSVQTSFKDAIIQNKDVRILEDTSGHRLIFYSFADPSTLVITTSEQALREVFARLSASQFLR